MKRKTEKVLTRPTYYSKIINPWFFWKKCCECGNEFCKEKIYRISIIYNVKHNVCGDYNKDFYYFCNNCCESLVDAENIFINKYYSAYNYFQERKVYG